MSSLLAGGTGVLLLGEAGVGKTALARQAEKAAVGDVDSRSRSGAGPGPRSDSGPQPVGRVFGHAVSNGVPFEAFAGVLPTAAASLLTPVEVARRVAGSLLASPRRRALFVVDDAHLLDDRSAQVLLQLAAEGTATVLATARSLQLPGGIDRLWRDGLCERVELTGLSENEVAEVVEAALGAPVDPATSHAFASRCEGNPLLLRELVGAALESSTLVWRGTAWTLVGTPPISSGIRDLVRARLAGLPEAQHAALETIAAGEPLAVGVAVDLVGEAALDELDAERQITVRTGLAGPEVSSAHPLHGEVLRADMPPLRMRRVRLTLAGRLENAEKPTPHDLVRAALWRLEGGQSDDPERLLTAARAARTVSLETAERLARRAYETSGSLQATLLLAEILTHSGRSAEAGGLTASLPPESLTPADREALVYCAALGQGLLTGDTGSGVDIAGGVLAGVPAASGMLRGLHASFLAFDARFAEALDVGRPIVDDVMAHPVARTLAAMGTVGAEYWLGRTRKVVAMADAISPVASTVRDVLPYGAPSIELFAICALLDEHELDDAEECSQRMRRQAVQDQDSFSATRAEYCVGRVALARGLPATALRSFRRCLAGVTPFDLPFVRHISSMAARAAATAGDLAAAHTLLEACADAPRIKTYEAEFELARAAVHAAELRLEEAAEHAAWAAGIAADHGQWTIAVIGYHDAARYGAARRILTPMTEAAAVARRHFDDRGSRAETASAPPAGPPEADVGSGARSGPETRSRTFTDLLLNHAQALAAVDPRALDAVSRQFAESGAVLFAAEAAAEAAVAHTTAGDLRPARASATRAAHLQSQCEGVVSPWLLGATAAAPLTTRERQVAALAARGHSDAAIAALLAISPRTVQTHLAHVYDKLGITGRQELLLALH